MDANGELTAAELALLRTHPQRTDLYLAIPTYATVFTATVIAPTPATNDGVYRVSFANGAGVTWADVVAGMTLMVGTAAGGSDIGTARIRDIITTADAGLTGNIYIGTTSEIDFTVGQHLTVKNDFGLWPRHPYVDPSTGEEFMDWDIDYDNVTDPQHVYPAHVPCMLPGAVVELTGASVTVTFDATDSWSPIAAASYTYVWSCVGATVPAGSTVSKTITFAGAATYLVKLELTANYPGHVAVSIGYRYVIVYNDANPLVKAPVLDSCEGDYDTGGWSYRVTCHSQAGLTTIRDRTLCILVAEDWYGSTRQSIGPIAGRENIVCIGWVDGESITWSNDLGNVSFEVHGPHWWLDRMKGYPTGVDDSLVPSTAWTDYESLTVRAGLWHFLHWRTTATAVIDIPSAAVNGTAGADTRRLATTYTPDGSLWEQLRAIADRIFARAACDRYGRLYINVDMQLVDPALRGTHPNILGAFGAGFTESDWRDEITIERRTVSEAAAVDLSGIYWSGTVATSSALFALSPGHYFKHYGNSVPRDRLALADQAQANLLAGLYAGWLNNEYPNVDIPLSANNRCFDIAPYMFSWMTIVAADTPRGIEWTNKRLIPRRVSFERDASEAVMLATVTFEAETFAQAAVVGDAPLEPPEPDPYTPPEPPCVCDDPLALNYGGSCPCAYLATTEMIVIHNNKHVVLSDNFFDLTGANTWAEATITGKVPADYITSLTIDPDGAGAWLVTTGVDLATTGVFRTDSIGVNPFTLVLSQADALANGQAYKTYIGLPGTPPYFGELRSCVSFGDGSVCVPEVEWPGLWDRSATAVFCSVDNGVTWTIRVPGGPYPYAPLLPYEQFWCAQSGEYGCHQVDWDGTTITITGTIAYNVPFVGRFFYGATATSIDSGDTWTTDMSSAYLYFRTCNVAGGNVYARDENTGLMILYPNAIYHIANFSDFGFRRTQLLGGLTQIFHVSAALNNTELWYGNVKQLTSGGEVATVTVVNGGTGGVYAPGDILTLTAPDGGTSATVTVATVIGAQVATVTLTTAGTGYSIATYATTGGGGTGCTIGVASLANNIPPFGIARILSAGEFVLTARDHCHADMVQYILGGVIYDRTGDLATVLGVGGWEGIGSSAYDWSGIEFVEII